MPPCVPITLDRMTSNSNRRLTVASVSCSSRKASICCWVRCLTKHPQKLRSLAESERLRGQQWFATLMEQPNLKQLQI